MRSPPSYQQWAALTGLHLTLDIWWNRIQLPWCMRYKSSPISSIRFIQAMQNKNSLEFVQFPTVTEFKPKTTRKPLSRDIAAAPWRRIKKRQTTNAKSRKEKKKKERCQAVFSPELKQLSDADECFVHCWLLNIVSDQCNQEQSPHYNEQVGYWRQISEDVRYFCGTVR